MPTRRDAAGGYSDCAKREGEMMGMFDYLRCKYPLPVAGANDLQFQTKDTDAQLLDNYEIREDGSLWHEEYDTEDRSDPTATGLSRIIGCMTSVNQRWVKGEMTGEIRFYSNMKDTNETWIEFSAHFVGGQLKHLEVIAK